MIRKSTIAFIVSFIFSVFSHAHTPGLSTLQLHHDGETFHATLVISPVDLITLLPIDQDLDGKISEEEVNDAQPLLTQLATNLLEVQIDESPLAYLENQSSRDDSDNVYLKLKFASVEGTVLQIVSRWMDVLPAGHRQFVSFRERNDSVVAEDLLDSANNVFAVALTPDSNPEIAPKPLSFSRFFILGVEHIAIGYDHLLFLFALLVVCESFLSVVKIISCFTLAHSLTLVLATFDVVRMPGNIVEPIIAASIVYVAVENILKRGKPKARWLVTFALGLIHGFGFAGVLSDLGISQGGNVITPLLSFNLGVEAGQIVIAMLVLPVIWWLKKVPSLAPRFVPVASSLVAAAGAYWFIERVWF